LGNCAKCITFTFCSVPVNMTACRPHGNILFVPMGRKFEKFIYGGKLYCGQVYAQSCVITRWKYRFFMDFSGISNLYRFANWVSKPYRMYTCTAGACRTYSTTCALSKVLSQCWSAVRTWTSACLYLAPLPLAKKCQW
jgi:hypothetical protein